ncbi:MAG: hypothetical protein IJD81_07725, partial [Oscillospiraceae bacterium]|nr:hypothetical protein [Oscillospiraceae bacterium]
VTIDPDIENGAVLTEKTTAKEGDFVTIAVIPDAGYLLESLTYQIGTDVIKLAANVGGGNCRFTMPAGDITINAVFVRCNHSLGENSTCSKCGIALVAKANSTYFSSADELYAHLAEGKNIDIELLGEWDTFAPTFNSDVTVTLSGSVKHITVNSEHIVQLTLNTSSVESIALEQGKLILNVADFTNLHKLDLTVTDKDASLTVTLSDSNYKLYQTDSGNELPLGEPVAADNCFIHHKTFGTPDAHNWTSEGNFFHTFTCSECGAIRTETYSWEIDFCDICNEGRPHNIVISDTITNGTVTADKAAASVNEIVTLTVTPDSGYLQSSLEVYYTDNSGSGADDVSLAADYTVTLTPVEGQTGKYTFVMPAAEVNVVASFSKCDHKDSKHTTAESKNNGGHIITCTVCKGTYDEFCTFNNEYKCILCGYDCGHGSRSMQTVEATCVATGTKTEVCDACGKVISQTTLSIAPENHGEMDSSTGLCSYGCGTSLAVATATVGGTTTYYSTLPAALDAVGSAAAADNATVRLLKDAELNRKVTLSTGVFTLDLNGKTLTETYDYFYLDIAGGDVTILSSVAGGKISQPHNGYAITVTDGKLTIGANTTIEYSGDNHSGQTLRMNGGHVVLNGGTLSVADGIIGAEPVAIDDGTFTLTAGTIKVSTSTVAIEIEGGILNLNGGSVAAPNYSAISALGGTLNIGGTSIIHGSSAYDIRCFHPTTLLAVLNFTNAAGTEYTVNIVSSSQPLPVENLKYDSDKHSLTSTDSNLTDGSFAKNSVVTLSCAHPNASITPKDDLTHTVSCSVCNYTGVADHVFIEGVCGCTKKQSFPVTIDSGITNGTVTADKTSATVGETVTLTATADKGYLFGGWTVTDGNGSSVTVENDSFIMPASAVTVSTDFGLCYHIGSSHTTGTNSGSNNHIYTCTLCKLEAVESCYGGTATCVAKAVCTVCGTAYGELAEHAPDANGKCTTPNCGYQYPAKVGDTFYESIHKALRAAEGISGCTLTLLDDITLTSGSSTASYTNQGTFTLDLNGKTLSSNQGTLSVLGSANLTIKDSVGGGKLLSANTNAIYQTGGKVTIEGGTFEGKLDGVFLSYDSTLTVKGGSFVGSRAMITGFGSSCVIDLTAIDPAGYTLKNNGSGTFSPKLPDGYVMVNDSDEVVTALSAEESVTVKASLETATVTLDEDTFTYDGKSHQPAVTVTLNGKTLTKGTDYKVIYMMAEKMESGKPTKWFGDHTTSDSCINASDRYYAVIVGLGNYYTKDVFTLYKNFVVEKAPLTIKADDQTVIVNGAINSNCFSVTDGALADGHTLTAEVVVNAITEDDNYFATAGTYEDVLIIEVTSVRIMDGERDVTANYSHGFEKGTLYVVQHMHEFTYTADDTTDTITAVCANTDGFCPDTEQSVALAAEGKTYDGNPVTATVTGAVDGYTPAATYCCADGCSSVGTHTASIQLGVAKVTVSFEITIPEAVLTPATPNGNDDWYTVATLTAPEGYQISTIEDGTYGADFCPADGKYDSLTYWLRPESNSSAQPVKMTAELSIHVDGTAPVIQSAVFSDITDSSAVLTINAEDNLSGVESINALHEFDSIIITAKGNGSFSISGMKPNSTYNFTVNVRDTAGNLKTETVSVTTLKAASSVTAAPTPNTLTYNGEKQNLFTGGEASGGRMIYSFAQNGTYTQTILQKKDAGTYTVWYMVAGDENHLDTEPESITVTIAKADDYIGTVTASDVENTLELSAITIVRSDSTVDGTLALDAGQQLQLGDNKLTYTFTPDDTANYEVLTGKVIVNVKDTAAPTVEVKLGENTRTDLVSPVSFNLYSNVSLTANVTASDAFTGIAKVEYFIATEEMTRSALEALSADSWSELINSSEITIPAVDGATAVCYVRAADKAGNVTYVSTDGMVFDLTAPVIKGVEDGETRYTTTTVSAEDKNLDKMFINDIKVPNPIAIEGDQNQTFVIKATDKAGNETTVTVTMKPIAELAKPMEDLTDSNVNSDDEPILEDIIQEVEELLKDKTLPADEKKALNDIKDDAEDLLDAVNDAQDAVDTDAVNDTLDITSENVETEDKEALEQAKEDLEQALEDYGDNYTDEEREIIEDAIDRIDEALDSIEDVEAVEELIDSLPETAEADDPDTRDEVLAAKAEYDALSDHEKTMVDEDTAKKLNKLVDMVTYKIVKGNGSKWTVGSDNSLRFTANGAFSRFTAVKVDGNTLNTKYYEAKEGSTIITLKTDFLDTLKTGKHTIEVVYADGSANGTFTVTVNPATGDTSNVGLWAGLFGLSLAALTVTAILYRRKRDDR